LILRVAHWKASGNGLQHTLLDESKHNCTCGLKA